MCEKEKDKKKMRELNADELEKVAGGTGDAGLLPPTVPENSIDPKVITNI